MASVDYDLRDRVERASNATSDADDLLTLSVPPEESIEAVRNRVQEEHAEAQYGDSGSSTQHGRDALERARRILSDYEETPENGLVIYAGVVDGEVVDYVFDDLPHPVPEWSYEFANEFDTGALEAATTPSTAYGLVVVESGEAALGRLVGDEITDVELLDGQVRGKTRAGGQSADRFERERERQKAEFFESVAAEAERAFLGDDPVDELLVGGTEITADEFLSGDHLDHRLRDRVAGGSFPVEYASEQGLRQLVERASDRVLDEEQRATREALDRFFTGLESGDDEVVYGRDATEKALEFEAVEVALVSGALDPEEMAELEAEVDAIGGECVVVSTDFERGERFREAFGGVAGLLRFPID